MRPRFKNTLLSALNEENIKRLKLQPVQFKVGYEIEFPGKPIRHLFFLEQGMASMTTTFKGGDQVEVGMFGYESVIGVSALMGTKRSLNRIYIQVAGYGYSSPIEAAKCEFDRGEGFQNMALCYVQAQLVQVMQSAGCNAKHGVQQRFARWLLRCADRTDSDKFKMPQVFLADMLGTRRATVTTVAGLLKEKGFIEYKRGEIHILDIAGLEGVSCECYRTIKNYLDNLAEVDCS